MTCLDKMDRFLNYLSKIYYQNPSLPISSDTIYYELNSFNEKDCQRIKNTALITVQLKIKNYLRDNTKLEIFSNGYYLIIENRNGNNNQLFYKSLKNAIKMYLPIAIKDLYQMIIEIIEFSVHQNILMQFRITKELRNDALTICISTQEDALKIVKYLSEKDYKFDIFSSPFIPKYKNIAFTINSEISYINVLAKLLYVYLQNKIKTNTLNLVTSGDFIKFIQNELKLLTKTTNNTILKKYNLKTMELYNSFVMISKLILKTLENSLTFEEIFADCHFDYLPSSRDHKYDITASDKEKFIYIINKLSNIYGTKKLHLIIMEYIKTTNFNLFVRRENIRRMIIENFPPSKMKLVISELGWNALMSAIHETYEKYGYDQAIYAIHKFIENNKIDSFTNENSTRSYLGIVIPSELLREVIENKVAGFNITNNIILSEILFQISQNKYLTN